MAKFSTVGIALLLWGILLYFCVPHAATHIQHDIEVRAAEVVTQGSISVDGRDVTLTGYNVNDEALKRLSAVQGVRSVHTRILSKETH